MMIEIISMTKMIIEMFEITMEILMMMMMDMMMVMMIKLMVMMIKLMMEIMEPDITIQYIYTLYIYIQTYVGKRGQLVHVKKPLD